MNNKDDMNKLEYTVTQADRYIDKLIKISVLFAKKLVESEHKHDFIEIAYVLDGEAEHSVNGENYLLKKGDIFMLDTESVHGYKATTPTINVCNILFQPEFLDTIFLESDNFIELACHVVANKSIESDSKSGGFLYLPAEGAEEARQYIDMIVRENERRQDGYLDAMQAQLKLLLISIFRQHGEKKSKLPSEQQKTVSDMLHYIKKTDSKDFSLAEMARALFFTPAYLSKVFKNYTNQSITQYMQNEKMERAAKLLNTTDMTVEEVMSAVGYSDKKYFYSVFQSFFGTSPGRYRNKKD